MKRLYIIAGCNGAGKTTAAYQLLPNLLGINEFINADEIARGLSPFNVEGAAIQAGRLMLTRIKQLIAQGADFAFETTLATRSYVQLAKAAQQQGYTVYLLFFWLHSSQMAIQRVAQRVKEGRHNIPEPTIRRRYTLGLQNFFQLYRPVVNQWVFVDNVADEPELIAQSINLDISIYNKSIWTDLEGTYGVK